jgi:hypothetical protein
MASRGLPIDVNQRPAWSVSGKELHSDRRANREDTLDLEIPRDREGTE